jgi:hypothetical protein
LHRERKFFTQSTTLEVIAMNRMLCRATSFNRNLNLFSAKRKVGYVSGAGASAIVAGMYAPVAASLYTAGAATATSVGTAAGTSAALNGLGGVLSSTLPTLVTLGPSGIPIMMGQVASAVPGIIAGAQAVGVAAGATAALPFVAGGAAVGGLVVGASPTVSSIDSTEKHVCYSWDCWKQVVRDRSVEPSNGRLLQDLLTDSSVASVEVDFPRTGLLGLKVTNIWGDCFRVYVVVLRDGSLAVHAEPF